MKQMFIPALAFAYFSAGISNSVISLFAVDIAKTFLGSSSGVSVGVTSQLNTFNAVSIIVSAIMLSFLAVRFQHRFLFLGGIVFVVVSAVGSFFAPNLLSLQLFYALEGGGSIIIWIMAATLIGDSLPPEKKAKAISYLLSMGAAASLLTILLVNFVTSSGGWRANFLFLILPISVAALVFASFFLPSKPREKNTPIQDNPYLKGFKQILTNKSATACLFTNLLTVVSGQVAIFAIAFYRTRFALPREWTIVIYATATAIFVVAPLISGRLVNRVGAKRLAVTSISLAAICLILFFFVSNLYAAIVIDMLHVWFGASSIPAFIYLALEQTPKHRGTMMALNSLFNNAGNALAPAIGGIMLVVTSGFYGAIGIVYGTMTFIGVAVLLFLVKDNTKTNNNSS
jgi:predicted MFS family arabinose efflux permease